MRRRSPKDPDAMTEAVRAGHSAGPSAGQYQNDKGELPTISLAPTLEERLLRSIVGPSRARCSRSTRSEAQNLATRIARALEQAVAQPVLLCTPALRPHLWRLFARVLPHLGVLSHNEVPAHVRVAPVAALD